MPALQRKLPREHFTRLLRDIASEVSTHPVHLVRCRDPLLGEAYQASFEILTLWVFGSWARGAPECGDLDLLVEVQRVGAGRYPATHQAIATAVRRRRKYVDVQVGTPAELGEVAEGAVLVWASWAPNYEKHIAAVQVNPNARRFARAHDIIPLDVRRLGMPFEERDELADAVRKGLVSISWRPADEIPPLPPGLADWAERRRLGADSRRVLPLALAELERWIPREEIPEEWDRCAARDITVRDIRLSFERFKHSYRRLDELGCRAIVVVANWTSRGPNGVMTITRGPAHPLSIRLAPRRAVVLDDGVVLQHWRGRWIRRLDLFTTRDRAQAVADDYDEELEIGELVGPQLLDAIDQADFVEIDERLAIPVSWEGAAHIREDFEEETSAEERIDTLARELSLAAPESTR